MPLRNGTCCPLQSIHHRSKQCCPARAASFLVDPWRFALRHLTHSDGDSRIVPHCLRSWLIERDGTLVPTANIGTPGNGTCFPLRSIRHRSKQCCPARLSSVPLGMGRVFHFARSIIVPSSAVPRRRSPSRSGQEGPFALRHPVRCAPLESRDDGLHRGRSGRIARGSLSRRARSVGDSRVVPQDEIGWGCRFLEQDQEYGVLDSAMVEAAAYCLVKC